MTVGRSAQQEEPLSRDELSCASIAFPTQVALNAAVRKARGRWINSKLERHKLFVSLSLRVIQPRQVHTQYPTQATRHMQRLPQITTLTLCRRETIADHAERKRGTS
jgi:hypothetical protein